MPSQAAKRSLAKAGSRGSSSGSIAPGWLTPWLVISGVLVVWDAGYVLMRPRSMPGGDLFWLWRPYPLYASVDRAYGLEGLESGDGFAPAQSWLNLVEVLLHWLSVWLMQGKQTAHAGDLLAFGSQLTTFWKTLLYGLNDVCRKEPWTAHSDPFNMVFFYLIPNGFWLVLPALAVGQLGSRLLVLLQKAKRGRAA
uniref:EXPERA domain-containing protein n=1 Tax=Chlamydomonas euryale TaxID=1486919 RepID=A0A7R9UZE2_9CHLO|mmetsp:Transcript_10763/g.32014  ORF Transcript_10763/g.32014 Transcript_10763/m.32014 type:complete len:195 (+) Transcript_10763:282-866(+)